MAADTSTPSAAAVGLRFAPTDDQRQLTASVDRFVAERYPYESWRALTRTPQAYSADYWSQIAGFGWLAIGLPEEHGGLGMGPRDTMAMMESLGRGMVLEPCWSTSVLGAQLIMQTGTPEQQALLLPGIADGSLRLAFAESEPKGRWDPSHLTTTAALRGDKFHIVGRKVAVLDAPSAHSLLVVARTPAGASLFLVDNGAPGLRRTDYPTVDSRRCSDYVFDDVPASLLLGVPGGAADGIERAKDYAITALCAEALGVMSVLVETTIEYLKMRKQFGRALSEFQVLRHRVVDMFIASEQARSLAIVAAASLGGPVNERRRAVSAAKWQVGTSGRFIGESAVQLHGGIGMTDELPVGHYFKRLLAIDTLLGNADFHLQRFSASTPEVN